MSYLPDRDEDRFRWKRWTRDLWRRKNSCSDSGERREDEVVQKKIRDLGRVLVCYVCPTLQKVEVGLGRNWGVGKGNEGEKK